MEASCVMDGMHMQEKRAGHACCSPLRVQPEPQAAAERL